MLGDSAPIVLSSNVGVKKRRREGARETDDKIKIGGTEDSRKEKERWRRRSNKSGSPKTKTKKRKYKPPSPSSASSSSRCSTTTSSRLALRDPTGCTMARGSKARGEPRWTAGTRFIGAS